MKRQIRFKTFETNSSNTNSLTVMTKAEYKEFVRKWDSDDWVWDAWHEKWILRDDMDEEGYHEYRYYDDPTQGCLELETKEYTSPSGDELVVVSLY